MCPNHYMPLSPSSLVSSSRLFYLLFPPSKGNIHINIKPSEKEEAFQAHTTCNLLVYPEHSFHLLVCLLVFSLRLAAEDFPSLFEYSPPFYFFEKAKRGEKGTNTWLVAANNVANTENASARRLLLFHISYWHLCYLLFLLFGVVLAGACVS